MKPIMPEPIETWTIKASGVTIIIYNRDNVLEWIDYILDRGMTPVIEKKAA